MRTRTTSLRSRLVLGAIAVGLTVALLFGLGAGWLIQRAENQAIDAALQSRVELARDEVAPDGSLRQDAGSPKTDLVQVVGPDGMVRSSSPAFSGLKPLLDVGAVTGSAGGAQRSIALQHPDTDLALLGVPMRLERSGSSPAGTGALIVAVDAEGFNAATSNLLALLVVGLVIVVLAVALLSWVLTGRALRSVTQLTESAEAVGPGELSTGLPVPHRDAELARLVGALNRMLIRLHESHTAELAFAADAGHRLRTPVATLRAEAELALRESDPLEQTAALERIVQDADQLTLIVERMLTRSRTRSHTPVPVIDVLEEAGGRWRRQAELAAITLDIKVSEEISPETSCAGLAEIIDPLLDNALRHTRANGLIQIIVRSRPDQGHGDRQIDIDVTNTGDPVPAGFAPYVFDAWVSSRDASTAGGLGLWLARETARDLGGDVTLTDAGPGLCTFRITLPVVRPGLTRSG